MPKLRKTYAIDHPRIREASFRPQRNGSATPGPQPNLGLLRANRDRLPRWG